MAITEKLRKTLEKRKKEIKDRSSGSGFFTFKEGKTRVRILKVSDDEDFAIEVDYFWLGQDLKGVISPSTFGMPCGIREIYDELNKSKDDDDKDTAKSFKPKKKSYAAMIKYLDDKGKEVDKASGAKLGVLTSGQRTELIEWMLDDDYGDFTSWKKGYDIKIVRVGSGMNDTEYTQMKMPNTPTPKEYRKIYNLEDMVKAILPSYEQTQELIAQFLSVEVSDLFGKKKNKKSKDKVKDKKKKKKRVSDI